MQVNTKVTMIGTLPPCKMNVYYQVPLVSELCKRVKIDFINFKKIYPDFLYPGGEQEDETFKFDRRALRNLDVKDVVVFYNPFTWVLAAFKVRERIVHTQWWNIPLGVMYIVIFLLLKLRGRKILTTVHNVLPHENTVFDYFVSEAAFYFVDHFIVHSEDNKEKMMKVFGIKEERISVIPMGIHDTYRSGRMTRERARKILKIGDEKVILFFGSIRKYKGLDDLIKAFSIVSKREKNARLLIVGRPWIDWKDYEKLIEESGVKENIRTYLEYIPMVEVEKFFLAADLVVLPYKEFDGQSGPGNIALAFGNPLVVTNVGGLQDLVKNKGVVAEAGNVSGLVNAIVFALRNNKALSMDSKELAKKYSWGNIAERTVEVYGNLA